VSSLPVMDDIYEIGGWITWIVTFLIVWIGCSVGYGFFGFALGWMPAIIVAYIAAYLWPLILLGVVVVVIKLWN
jgi:hypothetical protein